MVYLLEKGDMPLSDAVGTNCKNGATTDIKAQVPSICVCWMRHRVLWMGESCGILYYYGNCFLLNHFVMQRIK